MKTFQISVQKREKLGKAETKKLRKQDMVPCVLYGGKENLHFYAHENAFKKLIYTPEVFIVEITLGGAVHKAILKEIQFHPVSDKLNHIDFIEVFDDKPVETIIPVEITGASIGVKNGGKLRQRIRTLKVKGFIKDLPDKLPVDITNLEIGQVIKVGDLSYANIELTDPSRSMIVSVISSRLAMKGTELPEDAAAAPAAEGAEAGEKAEE
jgi:large subunit ribosomal protein L25